MPIFAVKQVFFVSDEMREACYSIMNSCPGEEDHSETFYCYVQNDINVRHEIMFSYEENGCLCGFIKGRFDNKPDPRFKLSGKLYARLDWLYVSPKAQRFGIGTRLLKIYISYAQRYGAKEIALIASPTEKALSFYNKHGFLRMEQTYNLMKTL